MNEEEKIKELLGTIYWLKFWLGKLCDNIEKERPRKNLDELIEMSRYKIKQADMMYEFYKGAKVSSGR